jgi:hypothetical protein
MEFFTSITLHTNATELDQRLSIANLTTFCASISQVLLNTGNSGEIYCLWGQFLINREQLKDGVRFTLPGCPNAAQWTITLDPAQPHTQLLLHLSINRQSADPDFVESIETFISDWKVGLERQWPHFIDTNQPAPDAQGVAE